MQTTCDVCGKDGLKQTHGKMGTYFDCPNCGSRFDYYYRKDGELLDHPASWGRLIEAVYVQTDSEPIPTDGTEDVEDSGLAIWYDGEFYYIFLAADGTIRRARINSFGHFDDETPRPKGVPKNINTFHAWVVDVLPAGQETGGKS